ncbi:L-serine ammonia-lyase, iron-sulfur-dependent, subunit alpha [Candidatus Peregrinibacteria bacterium]|nr:L-serine ammonia-lyase, iron-sulfur-dependent, subunit alpha [Candidatus Peregrinibacteria bacterium]
MYQFRTTNDLLKLCKKHNVSMAEIAIRYEMEHSNKHRAEVLKKMRKTMKTMKEAVHEAIKNPQDSAFHMAGGDAPKLMKGLKKKNKMATSPVVLRAMAYAVATGETNSAMGRIVAFPTAGGAGVVPGVMLAFAEEFKTTNKKLLEGLLTASAIGKIIADGATLSAAAGGCQAEVGAAIAMAAAGVTEMRGGTPEQAANASAMGLKSFLGVVCDPLGGLVAVPCIKRNMLGASTALAASDASLLGVESFIPFDEVVAAMKNIAAIMSPKLRETALGGLAVTKTGLRIRKKMGLPPLKPTDID